MPLYEAKSKISGTGLFSTKSIKKGDFIFAPRKNLVTYEDLHKNYTNPERGIQVHPIYYIAPSDFLDGAINHSCYPNAGLYIENPKKSFQTTKSPVGDIGFYAIDDIPEDKEITFDYSSTQLDDDWEMMCMCAQPDCRIMISDCSTLTWRQAWRYWKNNVLPDYALWAFLGI